MSRARILILLLAMAGVTAEPLAAQRLAGRVAVGPAYAGDIGAAGLVALELTYGALIVRGDAHGITAGPTGSHDDSAHGVAFGGSAGIAIRGPTARWRPWLLGSLARGVDLREGDEFTAFGAAVGADHETRPFFAELRYEYWRQHSVQHHDLPHNTIRLLVGFVFP